MIEGESELRLCYEVGLVSLSLLKFCFSSSFGFQRGFEIEFYWRFFGFISLDVGQ